MNLHFFGEIQLQPVTWPLEVEQAIHIRSRWKIAESILPFAMPYFQPINGFRAFGILGIGDEDAELVGLQPSPDFNVEVMQSILDWQYQSIARLRSDPSCTGFARDRELAVQLLLSTGLTIGGQNLLNCSALNHQSSVITAGLNQLRQRVYSGMPVSSEIANLRALLEEAGCSWEARLSV